MAETDRQGTDPPEWMVMVLLFWEGVGDVRAVISVEGWSGCGGQFRDVNMSVVGRLGGNLGRWLGRGVRPFPLVP